MRKFSLFRTSPAEPIGFKLYTAAVAQARRPEFYRDSEVPDSLDGRFDLVALHVFLVLRRLKAEGEPARELGQAVFDVFVADMDQSLREMGVGDLGVGRRVKAMAQGLYGRVAAYEAGLESDTGLATALRRNLFGTVQPSEAAVARVAAYVRREAHSLAVRPFAALAAGELVFGPPPAAGGSASGAQSR